MKNLAYRIDAKALASLVKEAGLTPGSFCRASGVSPDTWSRIMRGNVSVTLLTAEKIRIGLRDLPAARTALVLSRYAQGEVKILGERDADAVRQRLRKAAREHRMTMFNYLYELFGAEADPLRALEMVGAADETR